MTERVTRLPDGLRIVTHAMPHLETVSLGVWSGSGARHETAAQNGLAHLMEHMAFKGTTRRSAFDIAQEIEAVGGDINAATSLESTAFYTRMLKDDIDLAMDILSDILQNPTFDHDELEREKGVIAQEIGSARDMPDDLVFELFQQAAFPDQPLGRSILGTERTLSTFDSSSLEQFRRTHYTQAGLVLGATGAIDHDRLVDTAEKAFRGLGKEPTAAAMPANYSGGEQRADLPLEQVHLVLGFEGVSYLGTDVYVAQMLASVLGGGMSSRLFQEVRERRGLCYSIFAFSSSYADSGLFGIYAAAARENIPELIAVLAAEFHKVAADVDERELARARAQAKAGLLMSLESSAARAEQISRQMLVFDRIIPIEELIAKIDSIDTNAVSELAKRLCVNTKPTFSGVGPLEGLASFDEIAAHFK